MPETNIAWATELESFKLRSAAIIRDGNDVLLCAVDGLSGWFLPGGKVKFGESSSAALSRELYEEIGMEFVIGHPVLIVECVRSEGKEIYQEVCFYYDLAWPASISRDIVHCNAAENHRFIWVLIEDLHGMEFMPMEIADHVASAPFEVRHLFFDRRPHAETGEANNSDIPS